MQTFGQFIKTLNEKDIKLKKQKVSLDGARVSAPAVSTAKTATSEETVNETVPIMPANPDNKKEGFLSIFKHQKDERIAKKATAAKLAKA